MHAMHRDPAPAFALGPHAQPPARGRGAIMSVYDVKSVWGVSHRRTLPHPTLDVPGNEQVYMRTDYSRTPCDTLEIA